MEKKKAKESDLYPTVQKWLKTNQLCFKAERNRGLKGYSIIDVIGVKDVGGDLSGEVETIAVEVKKGTQPFVKASGQALAYKVYANRIYLADQRDASFTPDEIYIANHLGIGLIRIQSRGCKEVLSSPYYKPIEKLNLRLLEVLALGKCQLCGCFFEIGSFDGRYAKTTEGELREAVNDGKGVRFWNYEVAKRKKMIGIREVPDAYESFERRFICPDCMAHFFSQFKME